jgi:peptide/nickel transport system permease protein
MTVAAVPVEREVSRGRSRPWYRRTTLMIGASILVVIAFLAIAAPLISPYDPTAQQLTAVLQGPSAAHLLGTDEYGRDVWTRLLYAGRVDLTVGVLAVVTPFIFGTAVGLVAGYYGKALDLVVNGIIDIVQAFPFYVLVIALVFVLGAGIQGVFLAVAAVGWVSYARIIRGGVLVAKREEYILAARAAGFSSVRIMFRHLLPNVITQAIIFAMSDIVVVIVGVVTLGYLGLGVPPPTPDWGSMIFDGQTFITTNWLLPTIPGLAVVLTGLGLSLVGDGLADAARPE